ncbi:MAG: serine kinase [Deltaproteobacteria bacterium]|nr:serine kinase [Deltaproteobacteria bacterium]
MTLAEIIDRLGLQVRAGDAALRRDVERGYASDLMSDVIANGLEGDLWITLQTHQNTVAVASMKGLAGIVLVNSREPEPDTLEKARRESIPLLVSELPAFELIGRLHGLGLTGLRA